MGQPSCADYIFLFFAWFLCRIVEFDTVDEAARAINSLSGSEIEGRKIFIREVKIRGEEQIKDIHDGKSRETKT